MKKTIEYNITPPKGQALLNFNGRRMPDKIELFETNVIEEVSQLGQKKIEMMETDLNADFRNLLIHGDCLSVCVYLKEQNIKVDLVYIDPPFASGANYAKKIYLRNGGKEAVENDHNAIGEEIMYGDIWQKEDYLNWLYERLLAIRGIMSDTGSIYVHLDWHIGHYVKLLMDEVFGEENFRNEISYGYRIQGINQGCWPRKHDVLFYYSLSEENIYNPEKEIVIYEKPFIDTKITPPEFSKLKDKDISKINECLKNKEALPDKYKEMLFNKYYSEVFVRDIWNCDYTKPIISGSNEYMGYQTQKSEGLLKRIIKASSDKGMIVADFFGGSGTTAKVANDLGRKFIACDIGINAIQTTRDRLVKEKADFYILKINDGVRLFRNPTQTKAKIYNLIDGFKNRTDLELGEFWDGGIVGKKGAYIPVKFLDLDKKLTKQLVDAILEEVYTLEDKETEAEAIKLIYAYKELEVTQDYINKEIRNSGKSTIKMDLISLDDLLGQKADYLYGKDNADIEVKKEGNNYKVKIKSYHSSYLKNKIDEFNAKKVKLKQKSLDVEEDGEKATGKFKPIEISETGLELIESVQFDTTLKKNVWTSNLDLEDKAGIKQKIKGVYILPTNKFKIKIRNIAGDEIIISLNEENKER